MSEFSNREWRAGKFSTEGGSLNRPKGKREGWRQGRRDKCVTCRPLRSWACARASLWPKITKRGRRADEKRDYDWLEETEVGS